MQNDRYDPALPVVKACRRAVGRMGFALAVSMGLTQLISWGLLIWLERDFPGSVENPWISLTVGTLPIYLLGMPLFWLMVRRLPYAYPLEKHRVGFGATVCFGAATYALAYVFQMTVMLGFETLRQQTGMDYLEAMPELPGGSPLATALIVCLVGPIMEELFFRRMVLRRLLPYGRVFAIVVSAAAFGLFHGNFFQMFMAFGIGLGLGYITVRTGSLKHTVFMHILINTYSSVISFMLEYYPIAATVGSLVIMAVALAGVVVLVLKRRTIAYHLRPAPVDQGRCLMQAAKSPGAWLFVLVCVGLSIWLVWGV